MQLKDKVAIVTGAARGIGLGIARRLAAEGAKVAIIDLSAADAEAAAKELNNGAIGLAADATSEAAVADATRVAAAYFGGLDIFVNNAGGGRPQHAQASMGNPFTRITREGWDDQMEMNLGTVFAGSKAAIPHLQQRGGGSIINISSVAGLMPVVNTPAYGAAKAGVVSLTRSLALELAPRQIRVNAICPGLLWTRAWEMLATSMQQTIPALKGIEPRQIFLQTVKRSVPLGSEQTLDDIGYLAAFLCSDAGRNITGQAISVDGGLTLKVGGG